MTESLNGFFLDSINVPHNLGICLTVFMLSLYWYKGQTHETHYIKKISFKDCIQFSPVWGEVPRNTFDRLKGKCLKKTTTGELNR